MPNANYVMITNMNNFKETFVTLDDFDQFKNLLSNNSVYEYVYISSNKNVIRLGDVQ